MSRDRRMLYWLGGLAVAGVLVHLLSAILLPFVAGMAVAYFLDPVADRLEEKGFSRALATTVITIGFFAAVVGVIAVLLPLLQHQVVGLIKLAPEAFSQFRIWLQPFLADLQLHFPSADSGELKEAAGKYGSKVIQWISNLLGEILSGGLAFLNVMSLILITPIVSFYLLREWDEIVAWVDSYLPRDAAPEIREQARLIDETMAGFIRGQASVCLTLGAFYGIALTLLGLNSGLLVGLAAGFISFVPYVGATVGMLVGLGIAFFQFGMEGWGYIAAVAGVFLVGQTLESYVLTPRLVGDRVGLHPLWIIFALMAGGALFGFTGVLLAVPAAAVIGVLIRYALGRYKKSSLYDQGSGGGS